jgi:hypothetical protein
LDTHNKNTILKYVLNIQTPQINKDYTAMFSSTAVDETTKKFIPQTFNFEKNMFGQCSICHQ